MENLWQISPMTVTGGEGIGPSKPAKKRKPLPLDVRMRAFLPPNTSKGIIEMLSHYCGQRNSSQG